MASSNVPQRPPASSLPPPMTPDRGRAPTRYPSHLSRELDAEGNPRPLLHRRGTSRTYETLEDLLKEAGYKETRVFTPEVERREAEREERKERQAKQQQESRGVGGAVVKLFSTWMSSKRDIDVDDDDVRGMPSSPLAHRSKKPHSNASTLRISSPPRSSSSSTLTVRPHPKHRETGLSPLQQQHSLTRHASFRPALVHAAPSTLHAPSRARIALRHAASAPHIDKRRPRAPRPKVPPLPPTWLASISAALLSPRLPGPSASPASPSSPRKPAILTQRAHTSLGAVTVAHVLCRSAPASRATSPHRVPTLAQTALADADSAWPPCSPQHLPAPAPPPDDDEDDELNLTTILIPAKRQHSIRSLRSVLRQHSPGPAAREEYARLMRRRIADGDPRDGHWDSGEFLVARVKRRRSGLPGTWGWSS